MPALRARRRADPPEPRRRRRQRPVPGAGPVLRRPVLPGGRARLPVLRADRADRGACWSPGRRRACWSTGPWWTAWWRRPAARTSPAACRTTAATRRSRPVRGGGRRRRRLAAVPGRVPGRRRGQLPAGRAAVPARAGRRVAPRRERPGVSAMDGDIGPDGRGRQPGRGLRGGLRRGVARRRRDPGQPDGPDPDPGRPAGAAHLRARPAAHRRRGPSAGVGRPADGRHGRVTEGWLPYRYVFRHGGRGPAARDDGRGADRPVRQPEHLLHRRLGPAQGPAARGARRARQHRQPPGQLLGARGTRAGSSSTGWTWSAASATTAPRPRPARPPASTSCAWSSPTWRCWTSRRPDHTMRLRSVHPGVSGRATSPRPPASRWPSPATCRSPGCPPRQELALIRGQLDPAGLRERELP